MTRTLPLVVWLCVVVGCDPVGSAAGVVVDPHGQPLEGAHVTMRCPDSGRTRDMTTDATGRFELGGIAMDGDACTISIEKDGYPARTVPVSATCRVKGMGACQKPPPVALEPAPAR